MSPGTCVTRFISVDCSSLESKPLELTSRERRPQQRSLTLLLQGRMSMCHSSRNRSLSAADVSLHADVSNGSLTEKASSRWWRRRYDLLWRDKIHWRWDRCTRHPETSEPKIKRHKRSAELVQHWRDFSDVTCSPVTGFGEQE